MSQYLVFVGAIVALLGALFYIRDIFRLKTRPNRVTWLMWSIAPLIAFVAELAKGVGLAAIPVFMVGFCPLLIFLASFVKNNSYWKLDRFDYLCGLLSVAALLFCGITNEPDIAIIFAIASDGFAAMPTIIKSWKYPETESSIAYITGLFVALTSFFALKMWNFTELAFPIYLVIVDMILISVLWKNKIFTKQK